MKEKVKHYLKVSAIELWLVNEQGDIQFFDANGQRESSSFNVTIDKLI